VALTTLVPGLAGNLPLIGDLRGLLGALCARLAVLGRRQGGGPARLVSALHRLRARSALHQRVELWWMTLIAQSFGIAFNLGALAVLLVQPSVLKYSFCWSTTLELGPLALHRLTSVLSLPWSHLIPVAVPSLALIESTQFDLLARAYVGGTPSGSGAWWPFILVAVAYYGFFPRALLAILAALAMRRSLADLRFDTPDVEAVLRRLRLPLVETRGVVHEASASTQTGQGASRATPAVATIASDCVVIGWRDVQFDRGLLEPWLQREFGWKVRSVLAAGGADFTFDEASIRAAASLGLPIAVVAEAFEPPDKAVRRFLAELRSAARPATHVLVALVAEAHGEAIVARGQDLETWSSQLAALEDAYLRVESVASV
jgi:hypothetical protein